MPKCIECVFFFIHGRHVYCRYYGQKIRKYDIELPCIHFAPRTTPIDFSALEKLAKKPKPPTLPEEYGIGFFGPRWISKYLVQSIHKCGDMSMAFDLLLEDSKAGK